MHALTRKHALHTNAGVAAARARREARRARRSSCYWLLNAVLWALTAANVAMFVLALSRNSWQIEALGINPLVGPSAAALRSMGAKDTAAIVSGRREVWRLASSLFLCSGARRRPAHLTPRLPSAASRGRAACFICRACLFRLRLVLPGDQQSRCAGAGVISLFAAVANLWTFGKYLGRVTVWPAASVLGIYVICGLVGAVASANLSKDGVSAGAPAAVCGLLGALRLHVMLEPIRAGCHSSSCGRCLWPMACMCRRRVGGPGPELAAVPQPARHRNGAPWRDCPVRSAGPAAAPGHLLCGARLPGRLGVRLRGHAAAAAACTWTLLLGLLAGLMRTPHKQHPARSAWHMHGSANPAFSMCIPYMCGWQHGAPDG